MKRVSEQSGTGWQPYTLLALANLFWAGNWVIGRALRDAFTPITLTFWRWSLAMLVLAPFALPRLRGRWPLIRANAPLILSLSLTGVILFQALVYLGLRTTTAINAVLINSSAPLFMLLCSWVMERERATAEQLFGMALSFGGVLAILARGDSANLMQFRFHPGDAWILLAMPIWGIYSVLLKRVPRGLGGMGFLLVIGVAGLPVLLAGMLVEAWLNPPAAPGPAALAGLVYVALFASIAAIMGWNRGVAALGANVAGFFMPLLPAFGTVLAIVFLDEEVRMYHLAGIATIFIGVFFATRPAARR